MNCQFLKNFEKVQVGVKQNSEIFLKFAYQTEMNCKSIHLIAYTWYRHEEDGPSIKLDAADPRIEFSSKTDQMPGSEPLVCTRISLVLKEVNQKADQGYYFLLANNEHGATQGQKMKLVIPSILMNLFIKLKN